MSGDLKRDEWKTVRLGDVCDVVSGSTPKTANLEYWDGDILWITPAELNEDSHYIYDTTRKITEAGRDSASLTLLPQGTVLLSSRAPIGKVGIVGTEMCCNQGFKNLVCSPVIFNNYLFWFLKGKTAYLNSLGRGATFKEISKGIVESIQIPLLPLDVQRRIADTLDKVSELITLRKTQLEKLDELVKARFVEMFGDPGENLYHWPVLTVRKAIAEGYIDKPLDGNHGAKHPKTSDYVSSGVPFIMANNIVDGCVDLERCAFISETQATSLDKGFAKDGDVLITHKGSIGNTAILKCSLPYVMLTPQVTYYRPINGLLPEFLKGYFDTSFFQSLIQNIASIGSTRAYIGITAQQDLPLCIPPFELQKKFAMFVNQIVLLKAPIQQSLDALETLRKSLMQEYFGQ